MINNFSPIAMLPALSASGPDRYDQPSLVEAYESPLTRPSKPADWDRGPHLS